MRIYGRNIIKNMKTTREFESMSTLEIYTDGMEDRTIDKVFKILAKNIEKFNVQEIRLFCLKNFASDRDECLKSSFFRRAVMYLDMREKKKT